MTSKFVYLNELINVHECEWNCLQPQSVPELKEEGVAVGEIKATSLMRKK